MDSQLIMIIEDDPTQLQSYGYMIEKAGFQVMLAEDASQALDLLAKQKPALIILDLSLPDLSGPQLVPCIRKLPDCENIPIVIISASRGRIESVKMSNEKFVAFLHKPITRDILIETIRAYFTSRHA